MVAFSIFIVVVLIIIVLGSAGTPIGRAMLPRSVTDAVSKLLPRALIRDATANADRAGPVGRNAQTRADARNQRRERERTARRRLRLVTRSLQEFDGRLIEIV